MRRVKAALAPWIPPRVLAPLNLYRFWRAQSPYVKNWRLCWLAQSLPLARPLLARTQVAGLRFRRGGVVTAELVNGRTIACYPASLGVLGVFSEYFAKDGGLPVLKNGDVVVDIGAHIGAMSVPMAGQEGVRVFAYEPDPDNFQLLSYNQSQNRLQNLHVTNKAVASASGAELTFNLGYSSTGGSLRSAEFAYAQDGARSVAVQTVTLPEIFAEHALTRVMLLKIDVEGAEYAILLDADCREVLRRVENILIEVHPTSRKNAKYELFEFLKSCGFAVTVIDRYRNGCEDFVCQRVDR